jgi:hypothetical protein
MPLTQNNKTSRYWAYALLFVLIAAALTCAEWYIIQAVHTESGDFAANTLLIQDAKRLHLIHGNYSRIGFYHPGPAFLYELAFGELVFHDWLHLVVSPFSGQVIGGILHNAAWLTVIFALARRLSGALAPALLFTSLVALIPVINEPAISTGIWPPHLYFFPYAAMVLAIAPLVYGRVDTLKTLAVASGLLINGHAAFIPMLGVTFIVVLAANFALSWRNRAIRVLSRGWLVRHGRTLLIALGILFLFFVPLILATITEWPGPVYDYIRFGRANKGNTIAQAVNYVLVYWGAGWVRAAELLAALVLAVVLVLSARRTVGRNALANNERADERADFMQRARGVGIACIAATLAALYYAKSGVDLLDHVYIELFYYSVPAICIALLVMIVCRLLAPQVRNVVALVLALAAFGSSWHWVRQGPGYTYLYDHPRVAVLYDYLHAQPGSGRIVLDLEQKAETWGEIWGSVLALQAYAVRQHVDLICINDAWHISNTARAKCTPDEVAHNRRYDVHGPDAPDTALGEADVEAIGVSLYRKGRPPHPSGFTTFTIKAQPEYFRPILGKGWSALEGEYVWSDGPVSELNLPADPTRGHRFILDFGSFVPSVDVNVHVQAYVNGKPAGDSVYNTGDIRHRFTLDLGDDAAAPQHIQLKIDGAVTPAQFGLSGDTRQLGVSLYGIRRESK